MKLKIDSLGIVALSIDIAYAFGVPEPSGEIEFIALDTPSKIAEFIRYFPATLTNAVPASIAAAAHAFTLTIGGDDRALSEAID